ncbi:maleate cis-trans isomerase family protein [Sulfitobacter sp.]|uniref:maleate cis-trans isomerase family protein n=1 Tax=Sulfitobacter sp. TaxID=1903071 RepID=UPI003002C41A
MDKASIEKLEFKTDAGLGHIARIGLICLQTDQTIEHEMASLLHGEGIACYHARIANSMDVTPDTLRQMQHDLPETAALLPSQFGFDAIGYGCTSGATMIGEERVSQIIREIHPGAQVSNPITACKAALTALDIRRIALVTPYAPDVTTEMQANLKAAGFDINAVASFNQSNDFIVARITSDSILNAIQTIGSRDDCDAVFVSCTSLRALSVIALAEAHIAKPVISSNQALAWHLMRLANLNHRPANSGQLFQH